jgi:hypothetical protein
LRCGRDHRSGPSAAGCRSSVGRRSGAVREDRDLVLDMIEMCDLILEHASDPRRLEADPVVQAAAQRWIEVLGEAASKVSSEVTSAHPCDPRPCVLRHRSRGGPASGERGRPEAAPAARRGGHGSRRRLIARPATKPADHNQTTHWRSPMVTNGHWRSVRPGEWPENVPETRGSREDVAFLHTAEATGSNPVSPTEKDASFDWVLPGAAQPCGRLRSGHRPETGHDRASVRARARSGCTSIRSNP